MTIPTQSRGFTIVELLIVIVVIAILAAITIAAYSGITNRAKTSAGQSATSTLVKKVEAYNTLASTYPTYCQLVTSSSTPTGAAPSAGTAGAGTCAAGGTTIASEAKISADAIAGLTPASDAAGADYTSSASNGNKVVGYFRCTAGANIFYWKYETGAIVTVKAGQGC